MTITTSTVHSTGWLFSQCQWKFSVPGSSFGLGFVATRGHIMLTSMPPPQAIARTLIGTPHLPSAKGAFARGQPRSLARNSARFPIR